MECCTDKKDMGEDNIVISKKTLLWIIIGIFIIANLYLIFKSPSGSVSAVQSAGAVVKSAASSGMVGGC